MTTLTNAIKEEKELSLVFVNSKERENTEYEEEEEEEEKEDIFEDCEWCGYTHPYEDKCPNEATAKHYEKWRAESDEDIVFCCARCNKAIIRNSKEHDECFTINDDDWYCGDCRQDDDE